MLVSIYKFRWVMQQVCVPRNCIFFEYAKFPEDPSEAPTLRLVDIDNHPRLYSANEIL